MKLTVPGGSPLPTLPPVTHPARPRRGGQVRAFALGAIVATSLLGFQQPADAVDLGAIAGSISKLVKIKKNLDGDVKALAADATTLIGDKTNLLEIKEQLLRLATETRAQIDSISTLVGTVEGHIKVTQNDIAKTKTHVDDLDDVRKALEGK